LAKKKQKKEENDTVLLSEQEVKDKITKAWCPVGEITLNPVLEYYKFFVFEKFFSFNISIIYKVKETLKKGLAYLK